VAIEHIPWASYPTASCPKKCRYLDNHHICSYYLITGIRRPCPAGSGCTVADTGRKLRPWEIPIVANDGVLEGWGADQETRSLAALGMTENRRPGKKRVQWDTEKGKALWAAGASDDEIAAACGISRSAVASYRRRKWGYINEKKERKKVPRPVTWDTAVGLELYRAGKTDKEIALRVGVGAQAVARYRRKHWKEKEGGQKMARKVSWDEKRGFCMYLNGDTDKKIADACGAPSAKAVEDYRRAHWAAFPRNREAENEPGG